MLYFYALRDHKNLFIISIDLRSLSWVFVSFFQFWIYAYLYVMPAAFSKAKEKWGKGARWMKDSQVTG